MIKLGNLINEMKPSIGDEEQEIRFLKNSKLFIKNVIFYPSTMIREIQKIEINDYRRL
jgi:hypothetical protein